MTDIAKWAWVIFICRLHLEKTQIYLVFCSICTIFAADYAVMV